MIYVIDNPDLSVTEGEQKALDGINDILVTFFDTLYEILKINF